ncbi:MAG: signal recognition particle protein [Candidatus Babeliales bacterium]|nr:signal recognition particle protein [Candidatus Babeliales bacterium]
MFDFLSNKFSSIFTQLTGKGRLTEQNIEEALAQIKESLLEADVPHKLIEQFIGSVKTDVLGQKVLGSLKPGEQLVKVVHERLLAFLGGKNQLAFTFQLPSVVMVLGLQGAGKTTAVAKMAYLVKAQAEQRGKTRKILLASVDFYRPAAVDQLEILSNQVGVSFYRSVQTDPVKAAADIYAYYQKEGFELLFLDTAGRLHIDNTLLQELRDIDTRLKPRYKMLVLDAMTGQESLNVAQAFEQGVGFNYALLTKMDSDTRGGAAFAFRYALQKPIVYVGTGEKLADLEQFHPDRMAGRILGMGDMLSLAEKASTTIKESEQQKIYKNLTQGTLTLQDFADQLNMMGKLGSLTQLSKYMPGMGGMNLSPDALEKGEFELKRFKAIIGSMNAKERSQPRLLDVSRKQRIAQGAGVQVADINALLSRFEQTQQFVKMFKGSGRFPRLF